MTTYTVANLSENRFFTVHVGDGAYAPVQIAPGQTMTEVVLHDVTVAHLRMLRLTVTPTQSPPAGR